MPNYSIWVLGESQITTTAPTGLDGVTQGDGSHLELETLTINTFNLQEVFISDGGGGDTNFADNDNNQRLNGSQTIDGVTYGNNTRIEAEFEFDVTDGTNTYRVIAVNLNNSSPAYGTVEGLAFVGTPPPVGVTLTVTGASEGPGASETPAETYFAPCFAAGTRIRTPSGDRAVETLRPGDRVITRDHGTQRLIWVGGARLSARRLARSPQSQPIRIRAHAFGPNQPERDMLVSPQHRILLRSPKAEFFFGDGEVLAAAQHLIDAPWVTRAWDVQAVSYHHLLFDRHEIVYADGLETESYQPGPGTLAHLPAADQGFLTQLYPELARGLPVNRPTARLHLRPWEVTMLMDQSPMDRKTPGRASGKSSAMSPGPKLRAVST